MPKSHVVKTVTMSTIRMVVTLALKLEVSYGAYLDQSLDHLLEDYHGEEFLYDKLHVLVTEYLPAWIGILLPWKHRRRPLLLVMTKMTKVAAIITLRRNVTITVALRGVSRK